jgi:5'-3' exonuclease
LPPNFQKYLLDQQSILRNPVDFYPDNVESVTYGSIRAHEAISLIPFLDQNLVNIYSFRFAKLMNLKSVLQQNLTCQEISAVIADYTNIQMQPSSKLLVLLSVLLMTLLAKYLSKKFHFCLDSIGKPSMLLCQ